MPLVRTDSKVTQEEVMRRDRLRGGGTWTDMKTEDTHRGVGVTRTDGVRQAEICNFPTAKLPQGSGSPQLHAHATLS